MKMPAACDTMRGFLFGTESNEYGVRYIEIDPPGIERYLGRGKFGFAYRYLYSLRLALVYCVSVTEDSRRSVMCIEEKDKGIRGNVIVLSMADDKIGSLSDFEINAIKENTYMYADHNGNFMRLQNLSSESRPMDFNLVDEGRCDLDYRLENKADSEMFDLMMDCRNAVSYHSICITEKPNGIVCSICLMKYQRGFGINPYELLAEKLGTEEADVSLADRWYTAYVTLPKDLAMRRGCMRKLECGDLPVHGGCTLQLWTRPEWIPESAYPAEGVTLGWDYHHHGDSMTEFDIDRV